MPFSKCNASRTYCPPLSVSMMYWMMAHVMELLTAKSKYAYSLLKEERYNLGGISLEESNRLFYAQVLASH